MVIGKKTYPRVFFNVLKNIYISYETKHTEPILYFLITSGTKQIVDNSLRWR